MGYLMSTYFSVLKALALMAQRLNIRLPDTIRGPLRSLLIRLVNVETVDQGIEDWSKPLIAGREVAADLAASATDARILGSDGAPLGITNLCVVADLAKQPENVDELKPNLRCLLVTSDLDAGGMDEVVFFLASRLPGHEIHTAVLHASDKGSPDGAPTGRLGRRLRELGIETVELAAEAGACWLETWRPDVISAHGAPPWVLDAATRLSIPYIDTLHGMHWHFHTDWAAEIERGRRITGIVAVSDMVRQQYLHGNPSFSPERIVTIPNGVDDWRRVPGNRGQARARLGVRDEYLFVSLARHCLQKNTYGLVAAFADVAARHPEAHLVIVGRVDEVAYFVQVQRLRAKLSCRDRIHLRDHISNPAELLAAADGFVLDSFFEGWSLASWKRSTPASRWCLAMWAVLASRLVRVRGVATWFLTRSVTRCG